jgi:hypothetical protein
MNIIQWQGIPFLETTVYANYSTSGQEYTDIGIDTEKIP